MDTGKIIEIVEFMAPAGVTAEQVIQGLEVLRTFYRGWAGFAGMEVAQEKGGRWVLVLAWGRLEDERAASTAMMQSSATAAFKQVVDPPTVTKRLLERRPF